MDVFPCSYIVAKVLCALLEKEESVCFVSVDVGFPYLASCIRDMNSFLPR